MALIATYEVLLIEDDAADALAAAKMLDAVGCGRFRITHVTRLDAALQALAGETAFDVALVDLNLPDAAGVAIVDTLLATAPELPLVVLSGNADERTGLEAVLHGAQDYLVKGSGDGTQTRRALLYAIERKRVESRLRYLAKHDALTGLANRTLLNDRLTAALARAVSRGRQIGLLFIDLDGFKGVNDRHGHEVGDRLLKVVAERLCAVVRRTDTVARIGGDEFTVLLEDVGGPANAAHVAEKILTVLAAPIAVDGRRLHVGASLGVAIGPDDSSDPGTLLRQADLAMYGAKAHGEGFRFCARPPLRASA